MIPKVDLKALCNHDRQSKRDFESGIREWGFLVVTNTPLSPHYIQTVMKTYLAFFKRPLHEKQQVSMALTQSNRGWGGIGSEQVNPTQNPDYKEFFDVGLELDPTDPETHLSVYAPNLWPKNPAHFSQVISEYYGRALEVAHTLLKWIAFILKREDELFIQQFTKPMALLRGNLYPPRPSWAGPLDFGIAPHTDYGCLTLLANDGTPGLEILNLDHQWIPVQCQPGEFIINFGEMLQMWSKQQVKATAHRVVGTTQERMSIPLFFNPNYSANVSPGSPDLSPLHSPIFAGEYLTRRYQETYPHLLPTRS